MKKIGMYRTIYTVTEIPDDLAAELDKARNEDGDSYNYEARERIAEYLNSGAGWPDLDMGEEVNEEWEVVPLDDDGNR
jgi:hypothetical protein